MLITNTILILVLTHSVTNSALKDDLYQPDILVKSYNYNHPPLYESFKDLPEADLEVRKVRQVTPLEYEKKEDHNIPNSLNLNPNISRLVNYDSEVNTLDSNNKLQRNNTTNKIKRRKQTRPPNSTYKERKVEVNSAESEHLIVNKGSTTEKSSITSPSPKTVVPKVFTKRPPEFNPIFKKIREREPVVKILEESNFVFAHKGNFHYSFEGADGTKVSSEGELRSFENDKTGEAVVGSVFYKDNEGNDFNLSYTADENGYRPHGAHLPTPPPIPPAIARALEYLATKSTPQPVTEATKYIY